MKEKIVIELTAEEIDNIKKRLDNGKSVVGNTDQAVIEPPRSGRLNALIKALREAGATEEKVWAYYATSHLICSDCPASIESGGSCPDYDAICGEALEQWLKGVV